MRFLMSALMVVLPTMGMAQNACFTERDMGRGLSVTFREGDVQTIRRIGNGDIERIEYNRDTTPMRFIGPHALYVTEEVSLIEGVPVDSDRLVIAYEKEVETLPAPQTGEGWTGATTNIFSDGGERDEVFSITFGEPSQIFLSGCSYDIIPAEVRYAWPGEGGGLNLTYHYLPALGASYLLASRSDGESSASTPPVSLTRLEK